MEWSGNLFRFAVAVTQLIFKNGITNKRINELNSNQIVNEYGQSCADSDLIRLLNDLKS